MAIITVQAAKCNKCGHIWLPKIKWPISCAKCKDARWNYDNPKKKVKTKNDK